ncbi:MAG: nucleotide exchange factor GrpE [Candidatus Absconditabacteria bacterium]
MTKKDTHVKADDTSLEEQLEHLQQEKNSKESSNEIAVLEHKIAQLEKEKQDMLDITKRVQFDYINLKTDFDRVQRIAAEKEKSMETDALIKHIKKILPVLDQLKTSLNHIDADKAADPFVVGVKMVYDNMLKALESLGIKPIQSIGLVPDSLFHEPLSTIPVEDKKMKGKIVQEFQQGFYLEKDGQKTVILTSKVVVGS